MKKAMQLKLVSGAIVLMLGAAGVWGQTNPTSAGPVDPYLLEDLALAYRILTDKGIMDGLGHASMRHPADPDHYLISQNRATGLVTPDDIIELDLDSNPVDPNTRTYSEVAIHAEIYKLRPDVNAVIHHHAPGMISFGMGTIPLRPVNQSSRFLLDGAPRFDYRDIQIEGDGGWEETNLIHTPARGQAVALALGASPALLLVNHGAVVVGGSISEAIGRSIYMEEAAEVQTNAMLRGGEVTYYDAAGDLRRTGMRSSFARQWDLWRHDGCILTGFCSAERPEQPQGRGGGGGRGGRGGGRGGN